MRPDVFLWEAGDACTKSYYRSPSKKAPTSGTSDYTSTPDVEPDRNAWKSGVPCNGHTDLFFPDEITAAEARKVGREFCVHCPAAVDCMLHAFTEAQCGYGIRVGMTPRELRNARLAWKRGTPVELLARVKVDEQQEKAA